jgi:hypothetical protein
MLHQPGTTARQRCGWHACAATSRYVVGVLLGAGADVHAPGGNNFQRNALQLACSTANMQVVRMLLDAGAEVNVGSRPWSGPITKSMKPIVSRYNGRTALQATAEQSHFDRTGSRCECPAIAHGRTHGFAGCCTRRTCSCRPGASQQGR